MYRSNGDNLIVRLTETDIIWHVPYNITILSVSSTNANNMVAVFLLIVFTSFKGTKFYFLLELPVCLLTFCKTFFQILE